MYLPYNKNLFLKARKLRNNSTPEENKLWYQYLAKFHVRFVRQKPIDNYILDFYCPEKKIGIELDGSQHYTEKGIENEYKNPQSANADSPLVKGAFLYGFASYFKYSLNGNKYFRQFPKKG